MQELERKKGIEYDEVNEIYSTTLRAGKRTYYLDVKSTLGGEHFLSITESRRKIREGAGSNFSNIRQTIYIYPEDFEKFTKGLEVTLEKIKELRGDVQDNVMLARSLYNTQSCEVPELEFEA